MEWLKKHWKVVAIAGVGVLGLYLLMHRGSSTASAAAGLPETGPAQLGNMTPAQTFFAPTEQAAAQLSQSELHRQQAQARASAGLSGGQVSASGLPLTGVASKAWQQVQTAAGTAWEDIYHPGHVISEQQAQMFSSQNRGPYAQGGGGFFGGLAKFITGLAPNLAASYAAGAPITLGSAFMGPRKPNPAPTVFTPGIAPTPRYGVAPPPVMSSSSIMESY